MLNSCHLPKPLVISVPRMFRRGSSQPQSVVLSVSVNTQGLLPSPLFVSAWYLSSYSVGESTGSVSITVRRVGNLNQYAIALCRTEQGTATSSFGSLPGEQDYVEYVGQVGWGHQEREGLAMHAIQPG